MLFHVCICVATPQATFHSLRERKRSLQPGGCDVAELFVPQVQGGYAVYKKGNMNKMKIKPSVLIASVGVGILFIRRRIMRKKAL